MQVGFQVQVSETDLRKVLRRWLVAVLLSGCATSLMDGIWGDDSSSFAPRPPQALVRRPGARHGGRDQRMPRSPSSTMKRLAELNDGSIKSALKKFAEVERKYPYSSFATKAILMQAYAGYRRASGTTRSSPPTASSRCTPATRTRAMPII